METYNYDVNATVSEVDASVTVVTLASARRGRKGVCIYNDSSAVLTLKLGSAAAADDYTTKIAANTYYEVPFGYTGIVTALWASATGSARVTEIY